MRSKGHKDLVSLCVLCSSVVQITPTYLIYPVTKVLIGRNNEKTQLVKKRPPKIEPALSS